ncbi:EF hand [mine drainage metagenome]|uniref:EF hand n=1 Tax=mine drainage metagenome TaxID=410659 RepID=A0A1J5RLK1_9ZZZZ
MSLPISGSNTLNTPEIWSGASMAMPPDQKMSTLFGQIDTADTGSITKSQFEQAFKSMNPPANFQSQGADAIWAKLDPNGTGSVSKQDFVQSMTTMMKQLRGHHRGGHHHHHASVSATQTLDQSLSALDALGTPGASQVDGSVGSNLNTLA